MLDPVQSHDPSFDGARSSAANYTGGLELRLVHARVVAKDLLAWFVFVGCTVTFAIAVAVLDSCESVTAAEAHVREG